LKDSNGKAVSLGAAGHLSGYFVSTLIGIATHFCSETEEQPSFSMKPIRWIFIFLTLLIGIGAGLTYGWFIDPVEFFDLTPDTLRADYKTDYVLMTAETYRVEQDPGFAARQLAIFGSQSPSSIATEALEYARTNGFPDTDIVLLQELVTAMQAWSGILQ
jgi:hypothetical protein